MNLDTPEYQLVSPEVFHMPRFVLEYRAKEKQLEALKLDRQLDSIGEDAFITTLPLQCRRGSDGAEARGIQMEQDPGGRNLVAGPGIYSASGRTGDEVAVVGIRGCRGDVKDYSSAVVDAGWRDVVVYYSTVPRYPNGYPGIQLQVLKRAPRYQFRSLFTAN